MDGLDWRSVPCRLFHGATIKGYGVRRRKGRNHLRHRDAWIEANGPIPDGLFVLHHCDVRNCYEPMHLFLGTNTDNMRDAARKGRCRNRNSGKTECRRGHAFTAANTYTDRRGRRSCKACMTISRDNYRRKAASNGARS